MRMLVEIRRLANDGSPWRPIARFAALLSFECYPCAMNGCNGLNPGTF